MAEFDSDGSDFVSFPGPAGELVTLPIQHKRYVSRDASGVPIHSDHPDGPWEPIPPVTATETPTRE